MFRIKLLLIAILLTSCSYRIQKAESLSDTSIGIPAKVIDFIASTFISNAVAETVTIERDRDGTVVTRGDGSKDVYGTGYDTETIKREYERHGDKVVKKDK